MVRACEFLSREGAATSPGTFILVPKKEDQAIRGISRLRVSTDVKVTQTERKLPPVEEEQGYGALVRRNPHSTHVTGRLSADSLALHSSLTRRIRSMLFISVSEQVSVTQSVICDHPG